MFGIGDEVVDKRGNEYVILESLPNLAAYNVIYNGKIITMPETALAESPGEVGVKEMQRIQEIIDNMEARLKDCCHVRDELFDTLRHTEP